MNAILLAAAGVIILLVGGGAGFWIGRSGVGGGKARVEKAEAELDEYKRSVTEHFDQTATHFQAIGEQYRELYDHMATGAHTLCEPGEEGKQLLFAPDLTPTTVEERADEAVEEEEVRAPIDFAATPAETVPPEEPVAETATESQPEPKADVDEQTLH